LEPGRIPEPGAGSQHHAGHLNIVAGQSRYPVVSVLRSCETLGLEI